MALIRPLQAAEALIDRRALRERDRRADSLTRLGDSAIRRPRVINVIPRRAFPARLD